MGINQWWSYDPQIGGLSKIRCAKPSDRWVNLHTKFLIYQTCHTESFPLSLGHHQIMLPPPFLPPCQILFSPHLPSRCNSDGPWSRSETISLFIFPLLPLLCIYQGHHLRALVLVLTYMMTQDSNNLPSTLIWDALPSCLVRVPNSCPNSPNLVNGRFLLFWWVTL